MNQGDTIARGRYTVVRRIGEGSLGEVFLVEDKMLGVLVAIKMLKPEVMGDLVAGARNVTERRIPAKSPHPGIVPILSSGIHKRRAWFSMEYFPDGDLFSAVSEGRLHVTPNTLFSLSLQLLGALEGLFENAGSVHRDIKPENIALRFDGDMVHACLIDFGSAHDPLSPMTEMHAALGTEEYSPPERGAVQAPSAEDWRLYDIWGVGACLYFSLFGEPPYADVQRMAQRIRLFLGPEKLPRALNLEDSGHSMIWGLLRWDPALRMQAVKRVFARSY